VGSGFFCAEKVDAGDADYYKIALSHRDDN